MNIISYRDFYVIGILMRADERGAQRLFVIINGSFSFIKHYINFRIKYERLVYDAMLYVIFYQIAIIFR